jgi:hypothetical protein
LPENCSFGTILFQITADASLTTEQKIVTMFTTDDDQVGDHMERVAKQIRTFTGIPFKAHHALHGLKLITTLTFGTRADADECIQTLLEGNKTGKFLGKEPLVWTRGRTERDDDALQSDLHPVRWLVRDNKTGKPRSTTSHFMFIIQFRSSPTVIEPAATKLTFDTLELPRTQYAQQQQPPPPLQPPPPPPPPQNS